METPAERAMQALGRTATVGEGENSESGISWAAIIAGGFASASLALILVALGVGLSLSAMSPWPNAGVSGTTVGAVAIIWLILTHIIASGMGGYLAGRLRTKWAGIHTDEVYFRDTAHGFLAWAVASIATAALLGSVTTSIATGGIHALGTAASTLGGAAPTSVAQSSGNSNDVLGYFSDALFRSDHPATDGNVESGRVEAGRILATGLESGSLDPADRSYLTRLVAARTGLADVDAGKRVTDTFALARTDLAKAEAATKQAAEVARKAAAHAALWMFVALLCGAFAASYAATWGGRRRDDIRVVTRGLTSDLSPQ